MTVILMGPKHCGKSSVASALKTMFGFKAVDLDYEIERQCGKSPRLLYKEGVEIFRAAETRALLFALNSISGDEDTVIAPGGGLIDNGEAVTMLKKFAGAVKLIYLDTDAATAWRRIEAAGELPPFLLTDNPEETHYLLHTRRAALYRQLASLTIESAGKSPEEIGALIAGA